MRTANYKCCDTVWNNVPLMVTYPPADTLAVEFGSAGSMDIVGNTVWFVIILVQLVFQIDLEIN